MNTLLKILAAGAGAYVVYEWFLAPATAAAQASATTTTTTTPATTAAATSATTRDLVAAAAAKGGYPAGSILTPSQWNYFLTQARGIPGPDLSATWSDANYKVTLDEWWAAANKAGVAGLGSNYAYGRHMRRFA